MELYTPEGYPHRPTSQRTAYSYYGYLSSQKTIILTYDGESYKRINSGNKTITWKDGSTSPYGERKTNLSTIVQTIYRGILGLGFISCYFRGSAKEERKTQ